MFYSANGLLHCIHSKLTWISFYEGWFGFSLFWAVFSYAHWHLISCVRGFSLETFPLNKFHLMFRKKSENSNSYFYKYTLLKMVIKGCLVRNVATSSIELKVHTINTLDSPNTVPNCCYTARSHLFQFLSNN